MNFQNLKKCEIFKRRKKSTLVKIPSVWCFLKSTRPAYYQLNLNDVKIQSKSFFFSKSMFLQF